MSPKVGKLVPQLIAPIRVMESYVRLLSFPFQSLLFGVAFAGLGLRSCCALGLCGYAVVRSVRRLFHTVVRSFDHPCLFIYV